MKRLTAVVALFVFLFSLCSCESSAEKSRPVTLEDALTGNNFVAENKWDDGTVMLMFLKFKEDGLERSFAQIKDGVETEYPPHAFDVEYTYTLEMETNTITVFENEPDGDVLEDMVLIYEYDDDVLSLIWMDDGEKFTFQPTSLDWNQTIEQYKEESTDQ